MMSASVGSSGLSFMNAPLAESFGTDITNVVVYYSIYTVVIAVTMFFSGPLIARFGARAITAVGGTWSVLMLVAISFTPSIPMLYVLGGLFGLTQGLTTTMMAPIIVNAWFLKRRGSVMGAVMAFSGLGGTLIGIIMPIALGAGGWQMGFRALAIFELFAVALNGALLMRSKPGDIGLLAYGAEVATESPNDNPASNDTVLTGVSRNEALRHGQYYAIIVGTILLTAVGSLLQHLPNLLGSNGLELTAVGTIFAIFSFAMIFTKALLGWLADRIGTVRAGYVSISGFIVALLLLTTVGTFAPSVAAILFFSIGMSTTTVLLPLVLGASLGIRDFPQLIGPAMAATSVGLALGAPLWGVVFDSTGSYRLGLFIAVALLVLTAALWTYAVRSGRKLQKAVAERGTEAIDGLLPVAGD